jgi:hypothetical protein
MGQTIKVHRPLLTACISGLYVILEAAFTIALLGVLMYNKGNNKITELRTILQRESQNS